MTEPLVIEYNVSPRRGIRQTHPVVSDDGSPRVAQGWPTTDVLESRLVVRTVGVLDPACRAR